MQAEARHSNPTAGIVFIMIALFAISVNDMLIKFLSGGYPLHEIVFVRSAIGICFSLVLVQMEGGFRILRTRTPGLHLLRCGMIVVSNMCFFSALAVLPLAEAVAVFFVAPLMITLLSIPILGEKVGPMRIGAAAVGFLGVIIMSKPWETGEAREISLVIYLLPVVAALTYAVNQLLARKLGVASKASAMAFYIQCGFLAVSAVFWLVAGDGRHAEGLENQSLIFLLRAWVWPQGPDLWLFVLIGFCSAIVGYSLSQAYRMADAATVAPFEYVGLPLAIFWGWVVFGDLPGPVVLVGILLIFGSGLFVFLRERQKKRALVSAARLNRR
ncbi:MAG: DMT family transporter [Roseovarius sp.]